jgi:hypothetical protein
MAPAVGGRFRFVGDFCTNALSSHNIEVESVSTPSQSDLIDFRVNAEGDFRRLSMKSSPPTERL